MRRRLKSALAGMLIHPRTEQLRHRLHALPRRLRGRTPRLVFFHRVADAWSWLTLQVLSELERLYNVKVELRMLSALPVDGVRDPAQLDRYAAYDAMRLARAWSLQFVDGAAAPVEQLSQLATRIIVANPGLHMARAATAAAWHGDGEQLATLASEAGAYEERATQRELARNHGELVRRGHYLSAMMWFEGEWYWGLDRLHLLEQRLLDQGLGRGARATFSGERFVPLPGTGQGSPVAQSLEFFFSFRSPYSYLAAEPVCNLADRLGLELELRPLLPMVNRGIAVPARKLRYIVTDVARVARARQQPFGPLRDPLGPAVERCLALCHAAGQRGAGREFMLAAMRAIWTQAADLTDERQLRVVAGQAGLVGASVDDALRSNRWRASVEANAAALAVLGLWGVPSLCLRGPDGQASSIAWGQDRLWAIERAATGLDVALPAPRLVQ